MSRDPMTMQVLSTVSSTDTEPGAYIPTDDFSEFERYQDLVGKDHDYEDADPAERDALRELSELGINLSDR